MIDHDTNRLSRLIALLTLLQTKRLLTAAELAERFLVSRRTIYRDVKTLAEAGVPVLSEESRGYRLLEGYRLPPVMFTEQEANALITAEKLVAQNKDASLVSTYAGAIQKIKAVLRGNTRDKANLLADRIKSYQNNALERTSDYLTSLQWALTNHKLVYIQYESLAGEQTERTVEPFALLHSSDANWTLVAWCHLRKSYRIFRLDHIGKLSVSHEAFQPHSLTLKEYFDQFGR